MKNSKKRSQNISFNDAQLAEVQVAELIEKELATIADFDFHLKGAFQRGYRPDILHSSQKEHEGGGNKWDISLSREGLYDTLPKGFFHQVKTVRPNPFKGLDEMKQESLQRKEEEKQARLFFFPLEKEFYRQRLSLELAGRQSSPDSFVPLDYWFDTIWGKTPYLDERQKSILVYLLPRVHYITGKFELTSRVYNLILEQPVSMNLNQPIYTTSGVLSSPGLGESKLGIDTICDDHFNIEAPVLNIQVGPISSNHLQDYLPGCKGLKTIELLNDYLLPLEAETKLEIFPEAAVSEFTIEDNLLTGRLDFTTVLSNSI